MPLLSLLATKCSSSAQDVKASAASIATGSCTDSFNLRNGIRSDSELAELRHRAKGKKKVAVLIAYLLKPLEQHTSDTKDEEESARLWVKITVWASPISNLALSVIQSTVRGHLLRVLVLLATGIDSIFDIGSNVALFWMQVKAEKLIVNKWPVGSACLENIRNIVYGKMASDNLIVVVESVRSLVSKGDDTLKDFHLPSIIAVAAALGVKLMLFILCYPFRKNSSQVAVLWEDHHNDLWINTFGILMSTGGSKLRWYQDPMGAIIIGLGIIVAWTRMIYCQFEFLAGKSAPHKFLQLLIYKSMTFSDDIVQLDTVRAYHSGPDYFVEIDIVMDGSTPLYKAHDVSQQLQDKIDALPTIERAFVHVDYETTHSPIYYFPALSSFIVYQILTGMAVPC
ncbi:CDF-like metal transporter [Armillaria novae-zelandiae]|uniref:CDF-like metal transporter n=1 Tax=Armillaria novae-zelandiae TaxID=153914 RepID=A0AA39NW38_9AGAR|nr:CDF-like metal transporter [Armillaria novae-zelandiae]